MFRIRLRCAGNRRITFSNVDVIKDAAGAMLEAAGCPPRMLYGPEARSWGAGPVMPRRIAPLVRQAKEVFVSTPDPDIAAFLMKADPATMRKQQPATGEVLDMTGAAIRADLDPVVPGCTFIEAVALTPIAISRQGGAEGRKTGKWHDDIRHCDISAAVNSRLSRLAGRPVGLTLVPDDLYLAGRGKGHAVRVDVKRSGDKAGVVVGLLFPFVLCGPPEDLRLAWYAGLGEKNRMGFGFFGLAA
ncbi:CRISPR-associated endoribonuclease Cas6 [Telmatospirillum sp. J64-1]|uniref:CRISPR-associated endoribonuclease Cas6 n=1 Tax=Telmatospirillum sp. J64-1 TaxID=2502183 RepID=UPI001C8F64FF|nr:CRISPR-associated endoribonuclease Cas6 [Telmatospirillum sp. J64-1]